MQLPQRRGVEGPGGHTADAESLEPLPHLGRGLVGEGDSEDLVRLELADRHLVRDASGDRRGLSGPCAGKDADRAAHRLDGTALLGVQPGEDCSRSTRAP